MVLVVAGVVVDVDDLESPKCVVVESDAEGSSFFDFFNVFSGGWVEVFEECFADEGGDACIVSVPMAPEDNEFVRSDPSRLVAFRGVSFLNAYDVGLCRKLQQFPMFGLLSYQIVGKKTLCVPGGDAVESLVWYG